MKRIRIATRIEERNREIRIHTKRRKETDFRDKIALGERNAFPLTKARNEREFHAETRLPGRSVEMNSGANCSIQVCVGWPIAL